MLFVLNVERDVVSSLLLNFTVQLTVMKLLPQEKRGGINLLAKKTRAIKQNTELQTVLFRHV
jgi:ABC-type uncharacterized transport system permease subunit